MALGTDPGFCRLRWSNRSGLPWPPDPVRAVARGGIVPLPCTFDTPGGPLRPATIRHFRAPLGLPPVTSSDRRDAWTPYQWPCLPHSVCIRTLRYEGVPALPARALPVLQRKESHPQRKAGARPWLRHAGPTAPAPARLPAIRLDVPNHSMTGTASHELTVSGHPARLLRLRNVSDNPTQGIRKRPLRSLDLGCIYPG